MEKKKLSLKGIFVKYLLVEIIGAIFWVLITAVIVFVIILYQVKTDANTTEQAFEKWIEDSVDAGELLYAELPAGVEIYVHDGDEEIFTNLQSNEKDKLLSYFNTNAIIANNSYNQFLDKTKVYRQYAILGLRVEAGYSIEAEYSSYNPEKIVFYFGIIVLFLVEVLWLVFTTRYYARWIQTELGKLEYASEQIGNQNLDFSIEGSQIKEIDNLATTFEIMRCKTKESIEALWRAEKNRRKKNIELAHNIKTALTVIRGNTDLMLETEISLKQEEYLQIMRKRETEIINYTLSIVKDNGL